MGFFQFFLGLRNPTSASELEGVWERMDDNFEGCIIRVEQTKQELMAKIIVSTPKMLSYGWNIGDQKWRHIEGSFENGWKIMDLRKQYDTQKKIVLSVDYAPYWISIGRSGNIHLHQSKIPLFAAQIWRKVG